MPAPPTVRLLERALRHGGFSRRDAKFIVATFRDVQPRQSVRDVLRRRGLCAADVLEAADAHTDTSRPSRARGVA